MARYNGPVCRLCRREGQKLFLKGDRCMSERCAIERRAYPPGQHGAKRGKLSEFGLQLREKQKVKRVYGLMEKQFRLTFDRAAQARTVTSEQFFRNLEMRLDNIVFRMGFSRSRQEARQVVRHDHIRVNGKKNNIPSCQLRVGDVVEIAQGSQKVALFGLAGEHFAKRAKLGWFDVDHGKFSGKIVALPQRDDIQLNVKDRSIVELYSK